MYYVNESVRQLYRAEDMQGRNHYLRLDMNENPEGLPQEFVKKVLSTVTPQTLAAYPENENLEKVLAQFHRLKQENICLSNGSVDAIRLIYEVFGKAGSEIVLTEPSFAMYAVFGEMFGFKVRKASYGEAWKMDKDKILKLINTNTDIVVLVNPNNPIGDVWKEKDLEEIIEKAGSCQAVVVLDEAYHYFYPVTYVSWVEKYPHMLVLRTFSKLFSMAGLRLGYAVGEEKLISYMRKARTPFQVNALALKFGEAVLKEDGLIEKLMEKAIEGKQFLLEQMKKEGYEIHVAEGNYLFFRPRTNVAAVKRGLEERGILIKNYGEGNLKGYIRVTTGSKMIMMQFIKALKEVDRERL